jgi:exopolysaccharide biosynthesis polyprenyl glycosylphosphotransferase
LGVAGSLVGATSLVAAYALREGALFCEPSLGLCDQAKPYISLLPFVGLIRAAFLLRRRPWTTRRVAGYFDEVGEAISDAALGSLFIVFFAFIFRSGHTFRAFSYSRLIFLYDWLIATFLLVVLAVVTKAVLVNLRKRRHNERNIAIIRAHHAPDFVTELVSRFPELGYQVVGTIEVTSDEDAAGLQGQLLQLVHGRRVHEAILLLPRLSREVLSTLVGVAELAKLQIKAVPELFGLPPTKVSLGQIGNVPLLALLDEPLPGGRRLVKRAIDVVFAAVLTTVAAPLMGAITIAIKLSSSGPTLIRQTRVGMDGRPFTLLKFRTMMIDTDPGIHENYVAKLIKGPGSLTVADQTLFKLSDDPRITPLGRVLRRYSLDELPQLINVLRGDMSLVGPRPALPFEVSMYEDWHRRRLEVRPGVTGLWQVSGRSRVGFHDMVSQDIEYIERWSPLLDLLIILRTLPALARAETY